MQYTKLKKEQLPTKLLYNQVPERKAVGLLESVKV